MPTGADTDLVLAGEFPAPDHDQWAAAVAKALDRSGTLAPDEAVERLRSTTYDGIVIEPLYTAADAPDPDAAGFPGLAPFARGPDAGRHPPGRLGRAPARRRRSRDRSGGQGAREGRDVGVARPRRRGDARRVHGGRRPRRRAPRPRRCRPRRRRPLARGGRRDRRPPARRLARRRPARHRRRRPRGHRRRRAPRCRRRVDRAARPRSRRPAGADRRRDPLPRRRGVRRPAARRHRRRGHRVPPPPRRPRRRPGRRDRPDRAAPRRDRGPVRHDRHVPGRPRAVGPGGRAGRRRRRDLADPRRHGAVDDDRLRPVGERAALDRRLLRRRHRRGRRRHGAAPRPPARRRGERARSPHRSQHAGDPAGGVAPRRGARPGRRVVVRGVLHRRARRRGVGVRPGDRGRGGFAASSGLLAERIATTRAARQRDVDTRPRPAHGAHRVPRRVRAHTTAGRRRRRRSARCPPLVRGLRGPAAARRRRGDGRHAARGLPGHHRRAGGVHPAHHVRPQLLRGRRPRHRRRTGERRSGGHRRRVPARPGSRSPASARAIRSTASRPSPSQRRCSAPAPPPSTSPAARRRRWPISPPSVSNARSTSAPTCAPPSPSSSASWRCHERSRLLEDPAPR